MADGSEFKLTVSNPVVEPVDYDIPVSAGGFTGTFSFIVLAYCHETAFAPDGSQDLLSDPADDYSAWENIAMTGDQITLNFTPPTPAPSGYRVFWQAAAAIDWDAPFYSISPFSDFDADGNAESVTIDGHSSSTSQYLALATRPCVYMVPIENADTEYPELYVKTVDGLWLQRSMKTSGFGGGAVYSADRMRLALFDTSINPIGWKKLNMWRDRNVRLKLQEGAAASFISHSKDEGIVSSFPAATHIRLLGDYSQWYQPGQVFAVSGAGTANGTYHVKESQYSGGFTDVYTFETIDNSAVGTSNWLLTLGSYPVYLGGASTPAYCKVLACNNQLWQKGKRSGPDCMVMLGLEAQGVAT